MSCTLNFRVWGSLNVICSLLSSLLKVSAHALLQDFISHEHPENFGGIIVVSQRKGRSSSSCGSGSCDMRKALTPVSLMNSLEASPNVQKRSQVLSTYSFVAMVMIFVSSVNWQGVCSFPIFNRCTPLMRPWSTSSTRVQLRACATTMVIRSIFAK